MARAPGRLDVMGGIADYSGSLVLQVSCCTRDEKRLVLSSRIISSRAEKKTI